MTAQHEQRYCIKSCQKLGNTQVETIRKIQQAFGDDAMSNSRIKEWYNRFKYGRTSVDSERRSGRPSTSRNENVIEQVRTLVVEDRRITVREPANDRGKHWIGTLNFDRGFGHEESGSSIMKHNIPVVRQAPYSDMALCDFRLFPNLKMPLKGTRFESREDIVRNATARLITITKDAFQKCFQQWRKRWEVCVHYQGDNFEGD
ncbi:hypothetical protein B7P43_G17106 [Cryptotermes secundus]|uniref:Mos1 transposase HTH domain-containing protein n=1 Tax=Cryptotermes secundus TaxID=105785 RepID=A0A2J7Q418_9NEOP|nr:hypothetical protein B7P43_G17106 [Cryptotermes secundus]